MKYWNNDKVKTFPVHKRKNFKKTKYDNCGSNKYVKPRSFRNRRSFEKKFSQQIVNPKDPLNLLELEKRQEERENMGLSPLPGDSAFNTPIINSDNNNNSSYYTYNQRKNDYNSFRFKGRYGNSKNRNRFTPYSNQSARNIEFTQYFNGYHFKTKPEERLKYFLPDWFDYSFVCDYGCHRGDFSFKLFERFHMKIARLDCIDVRKSCLLNAKHIQREKKRCEIIRQSNSENNENNGSSPFLDYSKIFFRYGNWVKDRESSEIKDDSEYDIVIALGVTKLIHLYYGDTGLEKFLRRACHRLKPGGHLIVELQSRKKYIEAVKDIGKPFIAKNFKNIKIQADKLEPLLASVGFPYCCKINTTMWNSKNDQGDILLCTKPIGTTPVPIRDINTSELMLKYSKKISENSTTTPLTPPRNLPSNTSLCSNNSNGYNICGSGDMYNNNHNNSNCDNKYSSISPLYNQSPRIVYSPQSADERFSLSSNNNDDDDDDETNSIIILNNDDDDDDDDDDDIVQLPDSTTIPSDNTDAEQRYHFG